MSNVIGVRGKIPQQEKKVAAMKPGQVGYITEWEYDSLTGDVNEQATLSSKGGTCSVRVECVKPHLYSLTFETPVYSNR